MSSSDDPHVQRPSELFRTHPDADLAFCFPPAAIDDLEQTRGGPLLLWFGAMHGVRTVGQLRRMVDDARRAAPAPWETDAAETARPPRRS